MDCQQGKKEEQPDDEPCPDDFLLCRVCALLLAEPVSLPCCGHSCCRTCLVKELKRKARQCPCCDKPCYTRAEDQPQNVMIAQIAKEMFPDLLERRLRETEAEKAEFELSLPAFFYNVPVFPDQTLCLQFYEPRYKLMMKRIINTSRRFAYVLPVVSAGSKRRVALVAHVCEAEFLSDGRAMVKTKLLGRYTVKHERVEAGTGGLHYCQLDPFEDDPPSVAGEASEVENLHARAKALCHGFLRPFKGQLVQEYGEMPSDAARMSMWLASFLPFHVAEKHALVRSRCTRERLQACLDCAASMMELARESIRREEKSSVGDDAAAAAADDAAAAASAAAPDPPPPPHPPAGAAEAEAEAASEVVNMVEG